MSIQSLAAVLARIDTQRQAAEDRLVPFLRIPSISTDPAHEGDCRQAAQWLAGQLGEIGFAATLEETASHPVVYASRPKPGAPHVLFYGHYDVQPIDPAEDWTGAAHWKDGVTRPLSEHPAFDPRFVEVDGRRRVVARGASDDKGQVMTFVEACRAMIEETGDLPVGVTFVIEGAEEDGSKGFDEWVKANASRLAADVALVCDTGMWDRETPWITNSLRGLVYLELTVTLNEKGLHSGIHGGSVPNPNNVIADIIAGLHDADRRVTLPGFYDGVREPSPEQRRQWEGIEAEAIGRFLKPNWLEIPFGERGRLYVETVQSRPTCDVTGIAGGYAVRGKAKTSIPPDAHAHVSFRLVGDQDPDAVVRSFEAYARERAQGCRIEVRAQPGSRAVVVPDDMPQLAIARRALLAEWGREPVEMGLGGSIPAIGTFKDIGIDSLLIGFALVDDNIHAPDEKYEMASFHRGTRSWARILAALGEAQVR